MATNKPKKPRTRKAPKPEYLNSGNAQSVANRGLNAAFTQAHGIPTYVGERDMVTNKVTGKTKNFGDGHWEEGPGYTSTKSGRLSTNGRTAGGSTWTFTAKDDDGNKVSQSGRSGVATRRQRYYDVRVGLGLAGG